MTAATIPLFSDTGLCAWDRVRRAVHEASRLGTAFQIAGAGVVIAEPAELPMSLHTELAEFANNGLLRSFLGGGRDPDRLAVAFADKLGIARVLVTTREATRDAVRRLIRDLRAHGGALGIDIETSLHSGQGKPRPFVRLNLDGTPSEHQPEWKGRAALDPHRADITTLQLYAGGECCYVFRGDALRIVLRSHWLRRQNLVAHNAGFESAFLQHHARYRRPKYRKSFGRRLDCTMQAAGLLYGVGHHGEGRSLETAAARVFGLKVPKELQTSDWSAPELSAGQIAYAAVDAILAWRLWRCLVPQLREKGRWAAYELQRRAIPAVADMELRGLGIDREEHKRQTHLWNEALAAARHTYQELTGQPPPAKPADIRSWLQQTLSPQELTRWPRTDKDNLLSVGAAALKHLIDVPAARPLLAIRRLEQLINNFGPRWLEHVGPVTGRLHCHYNIAGTKAGRFSAEAPNPQQLPSGKAPEFKRCIVADPGNLLVGCDWNQIEMRAAAWISGDQALTRVYAEGRDIHAETAGRIVGVAPESVSKEQRQAAKPVNFGAIYGIGAAMLRENAFAEYGVEMTLRQAENALDRFFDNYRQLGRWRRRHHDICKARGYVEIGCGRVVEAAWETDTGGQLIFTRCCNLPVQGICADAILRAITWTYTQLKQAGIRGGLVACVHDELLLEVDEADAERARDILQRTMIDAFVATFAGAPTNGVAAAKIGLSWAEVK
jgi:DNA polymerase-1